jgi:hypothetical protein
MAVGNLPPERSLTRAVNKASAWRFYVVSSCHIALIVVATLLGILAAFVTVSDPPASLQHVADNIWPVLGTMLSSGGLGAFLMKMDQKEREHIRYHQALDILVQMPDSRAKEKAIIDLVHKLSSRS